MAKIRRAPNERKGSLVPLDELIRLAGDLFRATPRGVPVRGVAVRAYLTLRKLRCLEAAGAEWRIQLIVRPEPRPRRRRSEKPVAVHESAIIATLQ